MKSHEMKGAGCELVDKRWAKLVDLNAVHQKKACNITLSKQSRYLHSSYMDQPLHFRLSSFIVYTNLQTIGESLLQVKNP
jgi:hypothetical protein